MFYFLALNEHASHEVNKMQAVTYNYVIFLEIFEAGYKSRLFYVLQKLCLELRTKQINRFFQDNTSKWLFNLSLLFFCILHCHYLTFEKCSK